MNYDSRKEAALVGCDDIIRNCERMTSGNFAHNVAAIKLIAQSIRQNVQHLKE